MLFSLAPSPALLGSAAMRFAFASILILSLAACFAPTPPTGAPCAPLGAGARCPSGQFCVMNAGVETCQVSASSSDGGIETPDATSELDHDGDGILDDVDNCPTVSNISQVDEDSDALGDVCDPCPPIADNQDGDGDGVGDACDPNPSTAGDKIVAFEGFKDALSPSWTVMGTFTMAGGEGVLSASDTESSLITRPSPANARVEVRAAFVIDSITATGLNLGSINVVERMQPNTDKSIACQLVGLAGGASEALRIFDTAASMNVASESYAIQPGAAKELRFERNGTSYACNVVSPAASVAGTATFAPPSPRIGLRVRGAVARWRWVMLVTSP